MVVSAAAKAVRKICGLYISWFLRNSNSKIMQCFWCCLVTLERLNLTMRYTRSNVLSFGMVSEIVRMFVWNDAVCNLAIAEANVKSYLWSYNNNQCSVIRDNKPKYDFFFASVSLRRLDPIPGYSNWKKYHSRNLCSKWTAIGHCF